jgi:hypothetical protein
MISYRDKNLLRTGIVPLDAEPGEERVDRILFTNRPAPVPGAYCEEMTTLLLDLNPNPDELFAKLDKTTAYEVRRARDKDGVNCRTLDASSSATIQAFWDFFQEFSGVMGYSSPGETGRRMLELLSQEGYLDLSVVKEGSDGPALAYHAYCRVGNRVRLMHACSLHKAIEDSARRAFVGRANRFLFWYDILRFKETGCAIFDFGGWYPKTDDEQMLRVNKFKEGFGGAVSRTYTCNLGRTLKGRLALWIREKLRRQ